MNRLMAWRVAVVVAGVWACPALGQKPCPLEDQTTIKCEYDRDHGGWIYRGSAPPKPERDSAPAPKPAPPPARLPTREEEATWAHERAMKEVRSIIQSPVGTCPADLRVVPAKDARESYTCSRYYCATSLDMDACRAFDALCQRLPTPPYYDPAAAETAAACGEKVKSWRNTLLEMRNEANRQATARMFEARDAAAAELKAQQEAKMRAYEANKPVATGLLKELPPLGTCPKSKERFGNAFAIDPKQAYGRARDQCRGAEMEACQFLKEDCDGRRVKSSDRGTCNWGWYEHMIDELNSHPREELLKGLRRVEEACNAGRTASACDEAAERHTYLKIREANPRLAYRYQALACEYSDEGSREFYCRDVEYVCIPDG